MLCSYCNGSVHLHQFRMHQWIVVLATDDQQSIGRSIQRHCSIISRHSDKGSVTITGLPATSVTVVTTVRVTTVSILSKPLHWLTAAPYEHSQITQYETSLVHASSILSTICLQVCITNNAPGAGRVKRLNPVCDPKQNYRLFTDWKWLLHCRPCGLNGSLYMLGSLWRHNSLFFESSVWVPNSQCK